MLLRHSIVLALCFAIVNAEIPELRPVRKGAALEVPMSTEHGIGVYQQWMEQAFSGLMAAVAAKNMKKLNDEHKVELEDCSKGADTVRRHARCLTKMFNNRNAKPKPTKARAAKYGPETLPAIPPSDGRWIGGLRVKRSATDADGRRQANGYELQSPLAGLTPIGAVARVMNRLLNQQNNKTVGTSWQQTVERIKDSAHRRKAAKAEMEKRMSEGELDNVEKLAFRGIGAQKRREAGDMDEFIDNPAAMRKIAIQKQSQMKKDPVGRLTALVRDGVKLGFQVAGENVTDFDEKTLKLISPRFLSVIPETDQNDTINLISPSLFSIHDKGNGVENLTSLPTLVHEFSGRDQQEWMNFIVEAAGVGKQAEKLDEETREIQLANSRPLYDKEIRGDEGQPLYFTKENVTDMYGDYEKRKIDQWERLVGSYTKKQLRDLNTTGYSVLSKKQLKLLYGKHSPFNCSEALTRLGRMNKTYIHGRIEEDVRMIGEMQDFKLRQKDITLSPVFFSPLILAAPVLSQFVVLSPIVFSPIILTPAVLGPIILSPWLFIPLILSPRVLAPLILTPMIFSPLILSPLVLHPLILSPGIFNPIILTPLVLSPLILSPQVFTPIILSPLVLNPLILNPMVGSPLILSPFVLSPLILSPQALFALVLSPYALSPLIETKLIVSALILSPSWLS